MNTKTAATAEDPSSLIDANIASVADWRGPVLARMRALVLAADPEIREAVKWRKPSNPAGVPVWERCGVICTGELYKDKVKLTFAKGTKLPDPSGLLNGSTGGSTIRAIDIAPSQEVDAESLTALVRAAIMFNLDQRSARARDERFTFASSRPALLNGTATGDRAAVIVA